MKVRPASVFEVVRLIDLQSHNESQFCLLIDSRENNKAIDEFNAELDVQTGESATLINADKLSVEDLIERLHSIGPSTVVIYGLEDWADEQFIQLDVNRSRLETGAFIVIKIDLNGAGRLLNAAPNLRSYIGTSIFAFAPDLSLMSFEEISRRLEQLRSHYQMSDELDFIH